MTSSTPDPLTTSPTYGTTVSGNAARQSSTPTSATDARGDRQRPFSAQLQQSLAAAKTPPTSPPTEIAPQSGAAMTLPGQAAVEIDQKSIVVGKANDPALTPAAGPGDHAKTRFSLTNDGTVMSTKDSASPVSGATVVAAPVVAPQQKSTPENTLSLTPNPPLSTAAPPPMVIATPTGLPTSLASPTLTSEQTPATRPTQNGVQLNSALAISTNVVPVPANASSSASSAVTIPMPTQSAEASDAKRAVPTSAGANPVGHNPSGSNVVPPRPVNPDQSRQLTPAGRATATTPTATNPTLPSVVVKTLPAAAQTPLQTTQNAVASNSAPTPKTAPPTAKPIEPPSPREASVNFTRSDAAISQADPAADATSTTSAKTAASAKSASATTDPAAVKLTDLAPMPTTATSQSAALLEGKPASPAEQVAQAVIIPAKASLADTRAQAAGPQILTIELHPVELGRVEIRIERTGDGPAKIQLAAEKPETLQRLLHDQAQLNLALDQAGIPSAGRTLQFSLSTEAGSSGSSSPNFADGNPGNGNGNGNGQRYQHSNPTDLAQDPAAAARSSTIIGVRSGVDITA